MLFSFSCTQCRGQLEADASLSGTLAECPSCRKTVVVPEGRVEPGTTLAGFHLERCLGRGGMGEVFLARQLSVNREVAVKVLPPSFAQDASAVQRFLHEGLLAARLDHANIVTVYEAGEDSGNYYLAMAYVEGETLDVRLKRGEILDESAALAIVRAVAEALAYAWDEFRMLHRDIKPANIMIDRRNRVFLMDLGLAKSMGEESGLTISGTVLGTPHYMSPEQALGRSDLGVASDVYSLGATLYHLVTGTTPYKGDSALTVLHGHIYEPLPSPALRNPALSAACCRLVERMMAKSPEARYGDWHELLADLAGRPAPERPAPVPHTPPVAPPASPPARPTPPAAQSLLPWRLRAVIPGVLALALVVAGLLLWRGRREHGASPRAMPEASPSPPPVLAVNHAALRDALARVSPPYAGDWQIAFDGASTQVLVPGLSWPAGAPLTIEAVMAPSDTGPGFVAGRQGPGGMWLDVADGMIAVHRQNAPGDALVAAASFSFVPPGKTIHAAGVWDGEQLRLYLNGSLAALGKTSRAATKGTIHQFCVGGTGNAGFRGLVDAVRVSGRALYTLDFEIDAVLPFEADDGTLCLLAFEEREGAIAVDTSRHGHDGAIRGNLRPFIHRRVWPCPVSEPELRQVEKALQKANPGAERISLHVAGRPGGVAVTVPKDRAVRDVSCLNRLPLLELTLDGSGVASLAALSGTTLVSLSINGTGITDLSPLSGSPLAFLAAREVPLRSLDPIADCPVLFLLVDGGELAALPRFSANKLRFLGIADVPGNDLAPLAGLPLLALDIRESPISDFSPLRMCGQLEFLGIPRGSDPRKVASQVRDGTRIVVLPSWEELGAYQVAIREMLWQVRAKQVMGNASSAEGSTHPRRPSPQTPLGRFPARKPSRPLRKPN